MAAKLPESLFGSEPTSSMNVRASPSTSGTNNTHGGVHPSRQYYLEQLIVALRNDHTREEALHLLYKVFLLFLFLFLFLCSWFSLQCLVAKKKRNHGKGTITHADLCLVIAVLFVFLRFLDSPHPKRSRVRIISILPLFFPSRLIEESIL